MPAPRPPLQRLTDALLAFAALLVAPLHVFLVSSQADPDLWGHLAIGRLFWESGIPRADPFLFSSEGRPWVSHEWLFQLALYAAFKGAGVAGLQALRAAGWAAASALIVASTLARAGRPGGALALAPCLLTLAFGLTVRPQLATYVGCALIAALLQGARIEGKWGERCRRWLPNAPWMLLPWSWLHGGFLVGAAAFAVIVACGEADARRGVPPLLDGRARRRLAVAFVGGLAATALNPYGVALWSRLYHSMASSDLRAYVSEWQSVWVPGRQLLIPVYAAYAAALVGAFLATPRPRRDLASWLLAAGVFLAATRSVRHLPLLGVFAAAPLAVGAQAALASLRARRAGPQRPPAPAVLAFCAAALAALIGFALWTDLRPGPVPPLALPAQTAMPEGGAQIIYPKGPVEFMRRHRLGGRVLADEEISNYVLWHLYPAARAFVDGRCPEHCDRAAFLDYIGWCRAEPGWDGVPRRYGAELILMSRLQPVFARLGELRGWEPLYRDPDFALLAPKGRHPALAAACARGGCPSPRPALPWLFP